MEDKKVFTNEEMELGLWCSDNPLGAARLIIGLKEMLDIKDENLQ